MNKGIRQHVEVYEELRAAVADPGAGYAMLEAQIPTSAALVSALMMPEYRNFRAKVHATSDNQHTDASRQGSERPALMSSMVVNGTVILAAIVQKRAELSFSDAKSTISP